MHRRSYRPKHVELIEITNKLLLLHLVGFWMGRGLESNKVILLMYS